MTDYVEKTPDEAQEQPDSGSERFAQWREAIAHTPTVEQIDANAADVQTAREQLAEAERAYQRAVVARACTHGFTKVADERGVSARQVHVWAKQFPDLIDLSDAPNKEINRQMLATQRAQREGGDVFAAQLDEHQETLAAIREGMNK